MKRVARLLIPVFLGASCAFLGCGQAPTEDVKSTAGKTKKVADRTTTAGVPSPSQDATRTCEVGGMTLQVARVQLGDSYTDDDGGKGVPQGKRDDQSVLGMRINVLTGDPIRVLKEFQPWVTDGTGATAQLGYGRADIKNKTLTILFAVPHTEQVFQLHFSDTAVIDITHLLKGEK